MGGALLGGWQRQGISPSVVVDPNPGAASLAGPDVLVVPDIGAIPTTFRPEAVVLAVKPQAAAAVVPAYAAFDSVFLSIMAGHDLSSLTRMLPGRAVVRAMPNTPASVGQGMTVACAATSVSGTQKDLCNQLLKAAGQIAWIEDETLLDGITAISGCGPAYVFLLVELLESAAQAQGISPELSRLLARQTIIGAGALLAASPEDAQALRCAVTSPHGVTQSALEVLMRGDSWPSLIPEAVMAATRRSRELAKLPPPLTTMI
jgi:pyrroline-5-carboxylate reductase